MLIRDIARIELVPDERRGLTELNGEGEVVSGIAMARYGANALEVIHNLKTRIAEIGPGLPEGVTVQTVYDRSELIHNAIDTLKRTLIEEAIIVALVCIIFLMHVRSALVAIVMLPVISTESGMALANASLSAFKWHQTMAGRLWLLTRSAVMAIRSAMLLRLASRRSVKVCAIPANIWPSIGSSDSTTCSCILSPGRL